MTKKIFCLIFSISISSAAWAVPSLSSCSGYISSGVQGGGNTSYNASQLQMIDSCLAACSTLYSSQANTSTTAASAVATCVRQLYPLSFYTHYSLNKTIQGSSSSSPSNPFLQSAVTPTTGNVSNNSNPGSPSNTQWY